MIATARHHSAAAAQTIVEDHSSGTANSIVVSVLLKLPLLVLTTILEGSIAHFFEHWFLRLLAFTYQDPTAAAALSTDPYHIWKPTLETIPEVDNEDDCDDDEQQDLFVPTTTTIVTKIPQPRVLFRERIIGMLLTPLVYPLRRNPKHSSSFKYC